MGTSNKIEAGEFELVGEITWNDVMQSWQTREGDSLSHLYQARGVKNWYELREQFCIRYGLDQLNLPEARWLNCRMPNPMQTAPKLLCLPSQGWHEIYGGTGQPSSITMAEVVQQSNTLKTNAKIRKIRERSHESLIVVALRLGENQSEPPMLIDGHHSASSIILGEAEKVPQLSLHLGEVSMVKKEHFRRLQAGELQTNQTYGTIEPLRIFVIPPGLTDTP